MTRPGQDVAAEDYALGAGRPARAYRPGSPEEVAKLLVALADEGLASVPWGGGVRQGLGAPPARYDAALDLRGLDALVEYEPADLTVTVQAGMTLARLGGILAEHNQMAVLESPLADRATVGGTLAAGLGGPLSHAFGGPRERVIGLRAALVDGSLIHGGGRVVKNVAGYDMPRLFTGSLGSLGVITEVTFKLASLPPVFATVLIRPAGTAEAFRLAGELIRRNLPLRALEVGDTHGELLLAADCSARPRVVERLRRELAEAAGSAKVELLDGEAHHRFWRGWADAGFQASPPAAAILRAAVPAAALPGLVEGLRLPAGVRFQARPGSGIFRLIAAPSTAGGLLHALREAAQTVGGWALAEHLPAGVLDDVSPWGRVQAGDTMRRLKQEFDPAGVLNPGRFVEGI